MVALRMTATCLIALITAAEPMNNHKVVSLKESGVGKLSHGNVANVVGASKWQLEPKVQYPQYPWKPGAIWNESRKDPDCATQKRRREARDDPPELCGPSADWWMGEKWIRCCAERNGTSLVHCRATPGKPGVWECHK